MPTPVTVGTTALVFVGGTLGVLTRAWLDTAAPSTPGFPTTTFGINVVGALALAALIEALTLRSPDAGRRRALRLMLGTGVLGGFTTYSALAVQTDALLRDGQAATAVLYAVGTLVVGLMASLAGILGARKALGR